MRSPTIFALLTTASQAQMVVGPAAGLGLQLSHKRGGIFDAGLLQAIRSHGSQVALLLQVACAASCKDQTVR